MDALHLDIDTRAQTVLQIGLQRRPATEIEFNAGDAVKLVGAGGNEIGRGLTRLGALDVSRAAGKQAAELELLFGGDAKELVIVHKDDLVLA